MIKEAKLQWKTAKKKDTFNQLHLNMENQFNSDAYLNMDLLRFTTAGSVDDGKSTLIGRLLYDSKSIFDDQLEAVERASIGKGEERMNLALLTDGLRSEREQGITIDVAYRYFSTPKRKFIIADAPGHIQYTRNMVTGASTANLAIILVDARKGIVEQTRRHSFIATLLQIPHIVYCINKMDLVNYDQKTFENIKDELSSFSAKLNIKDVRFLPISALNGDNVVNRSSEMSWYDGPTLMYLLENIHIASDKNMVDCRFPIQSVIRPQSDAYHDYRGYAGRIAGGVFKKGDEVMVLPTGFMTTIKSIDTIDGEINEAYPPMSVCMTFTDELDISRGDMIVREKNSPSVSQNIEIMVCWLQQKKLQLNGKYALKHMSKEARCIVKDIQYKLDVNTLHRIEDDKEIGMNEIARISLRTTTPLFYDKYSRNRSTGSMILIDESTNETVGACMLI
jgi:sulfate adenylyltransferase subunit 1